MNKLLLTESVEAISEKLHSQNKTIVLAGGCFDLLHIGHIRFLAHAKKQGDVLVVFLEHDESVKKQKGINRPIYPQNVRAEMLAALSVVDYIVMLPPHMSNHDYDKLVITIKPAIIATTKDDPGRPHKERQAGKINATVSDVVERIPQQSTSKLADIVEKEFAL